MKHIINLALRYILMRYLLVFLLILPNALFSRVIAQNQSYERYETVLAYLYKFPENVTWKNEKQYNDFRFLVISEDQKLISDFKKISKTLKIKNKPIKLTVSSNANVDLSDVRAIFISRDKIDLYLNIFDKVEGKEILLISDSYQDKRFVMINIYDSETDKLVFEVNKANIINQHLEINDEILLLGGNMIDVAELYRKSQQSLRSMEKALKNYDNELDSLNRRIETVQNEFKNQKQEIKNQNALINKQKNEIEKQIAEVKKQKQLVLNQKAFLKIQKDSINRQSILLTATQKQLKKQKEEIQKRQETLDQQQFEIKQMDSEIQEKTNILGQQNITIGRQRQIMILFIIVIVLIIALTIIIFRAYSNNRKKNAILNSQKVEIEKINEELKTSNEELSQKNEEISFTLEKLKEAQNQLIQSEKMASLGVLTAGIAHEINNPINFVYTGFNSLKKDFNDISYVLEEINKLSADIENPKDFILTIEKLKEKYYFAEAYDAISKTIGHIELGAVRTAEIIRGLRNFSRMEKEEWQLTDIHSRVDDVLILLKNKYKNHIEIIRDFKNNIPRIECYPGKINQVLLNILSNAIDAINKKGQITIKTESINDFITISVKDTGSGMNQDIKSKIFDPFFTTKEVGKGVGLGLSITYGIIQEHNGEIEVKSKEEKGTEFIIKLPIKQNI